MSEKWAKGSDTRWRRFRAWVLQRDSYRCRVGLQGCTERAPLEGGHVDHIIPLTQGGAKYDPENVRASCASCNLKRGKGSGYQEPDVVPVSTW
jgi:5-methylcytosine-specific restriction endonuclease McrA